MGQSGIKDFNLLCPWWRNAFEPTPIWRASNVWWFGDRPARL